MTVAGGGMLVSVSAVREQEYGTPGLRESKVAFCRVVLSGDGSSTPISVALHSKT